MSILGIFAAPSQPATVDGFWHWFQRNEAILFDSYGGQDIFAQLGAELQKIHPSLTFDLEGSQSGTRELVLSANGLRDVFPEVEALFAAAPNLPRWKFVKLRQRNEPADVYFGGQSVGASSVSVLLQPEGPKVGLTVFISGYRKSVHNTYLSIAFLFLDQALGEYDVETRVGSIEVRSPSSYPVANTFSLKQLPAAFDSYFAKNLGVEQSRV